MADKILADGLFYSAPHEKAPDFVKGSIGVNIEKFIPFLQKHANAKGWVNLDFLKSQKGTLYFTLNDYKPSQTPADKMKEEMDSAKTVDYIKENMGGKEVDDINVPDIVF